MVYTLRFFPLRNAVCFIILTYLAPVFFTFYIQNALKLKKKNNSSAIRLKTQFVPRSKHLFISVIKTSQLALCRAKVAICSKINTKHTNTVWAEYKILDC